ncbi:class I SAM-dependent methyltransferase [Croceicoccus mobilis]|uniref:ATP synthase subunit beta n=1 Tax=Croceicoccus mobilis TaxID=1703339 RepID=A0A917DU98_9SPHN|nr:SAM-dependent methyltransferase [Croceicoccus mobilis]GGD71017.1 ATP synthase subunit beta [Croceicoccus mobilis]
MSGTEFAAKLARTIGHLGPMPLAQFMAESNAHYYASRDPLGTTGDFTTAPEISQMFGEMAGGWLADIRARAMAAGVPGAADAAYVELGPGRGTLAKDALRVLDRAGPVSGVHLVEGSPVLRGAQEKTLAGREVVFHDDTGSLPEDRPLLVLANEFFDALPIRQLVKTGEGWREIVVGHASGAFHPVPGDRPMDAAVPESRRDLPEETIIEACPAASAIMADLAARIEKQGGAILCFDYGHLKPFTGSSLQAVRAHEKVDPFAHAGEADLTAHVDFSALADTAKAQGIAIAMATQGEFLLALGIAQRASMLAKANPAQAKSLGEALDRLVSPTRMGSLFKVLAGHSTGWPQGAYFTA